MALTPDQQFATQWARSKGILNANETATGGLLDSRLASNPQLRNEYQGALSSFRNQSGAMPAHIEPLHQFERTALERQGNPGLYGGGGMVDGQALLRKLIDNPTGTIATYTNPQATQMINRAGDYYGKADAATAQGMSEITSGEIDSRLNPFIQNVINSALRKSSSSAERAKAAIQSQLRQRGGASFGDNVSGIRLAEIDDAMVDNEYDIRAKYGYQGHRDAVGDIQADRGRQLQAGQIYGGLGTNATNTAATAQGITNSAVSNAIGVPTQLFNMGQSQTNTVYDSIDRQREAGSFIRNYNQDINDMVQDDYIAGQNYPRQNIAATQTLIQPFQTSTSALPGQQTGASKAGGIAGIAGKVLGGFL